MNIWTIQSAILCPCRSFSGVCADDNLIKACTLHFLITICCTHPWEIKKGCKYLSAVPCVLSSHKSLPCLLNSELLLLDLLVWALEVKSKQVRNYSQVDPNQKSTEAFLCGKVTLLHDNTWHYQWPPIIFLDARHQSSQKCPWQFPLYWSTRLDWW